MNSLISEMISTNAYPSDYENITSALLFKPVDFATSQNQVVICIFTANKSEPRLRKPA